jgi:hypothetical protein
LVGEVVEISSTEVVRNWGPVMNEVSEGTDHLITRYGEQVAAAILHRDYVAILPVLVEYRANREAAERYEEWKEDPSLAVPYRELKPLLDLDGHAE